MTRGHIKTVVSDRGYGFVRGEDGNDVFFHRSTLRSGVEFDTLREGQAVEFDVQESPKGPRAINLRVTAEV